MLALVLVDYDGDDEENQEEKPETEKWACEFNLPTYMDVEIELDDDASDNSLYKVRVSKPATELEDEEANVAPKDTFGTITQRSYAVCDFPRGVLEVGESSSAHDSSYVGGLAPWALRRDL
ncbi:hypothetical protein Tco_1476235 [Tanacetum coccineum]